MNIDRINNRMKFLFETKIKENLDRFPLIWYDAEGDNEELNDLDIDPYEAADIAEMIARNGGVTILSDKDLKGILIDSKNSRIIGAVWTSNTYQDEFSFDIAIDSGYQGMGLATKLINFALSEYEEMKDVHGDDYAIEVDVINPKLAEILSKKYGFHIVSHIDQNRVIMSK